MANFCLGRAFRGHARLFTIIVLERFEKSVMPSLTLLVLMFRAEWFDA